MSRHLKANKQFDPEPYIQRNRERALAHYGALLQEDRSVAGTDVWFDECWRFHRGDHNVQPTDFNAVEDFDFSHSFTKKDYKNLIRLAREILEEVKSKGSLNSLDIFSTLAYKCPFNEKAIKCVFTLIVKKAISEENSLVVFYPIIDPLGSPDIVIKDFEFKLIPLNGLREPISNEAT